jgi:hypothetical protein
VKATAERFFCAASALLLAAVPAWAAPRFLPDRDVAVTYELDLPGNAPQDYHLAYRAADGLARIDGPTQGIFVLADLPAGQAQVVVPQLHAFVRAPDFSALTRMIAHADGAQFTPLGQGSYAGIDCRKYLVMSAQGTGEVCIAHDGVILHFAGRDAKGSAEVTALAVHYRPQPAAAFALPDGFAEISLPPGALAALLQQQ